MFVSFYLIPISLKDEKASKLSFYNYCQLTSTSSYFEFTILQKWLILFKILLSEYLKIKKAIRFL